MAGVGRGFSIRIRQRTSFAIEKATENVWFIMHRVSGGAIELVEVGSVVGRCLVGL